MRDQFYISTICYLIQNEKVLMINFKNKYNQVFAPPGGKMIKGETPLECVKREFMEETGVELCDVKYKGVSYWQDKTDGVIFIYTATQYKGNVINCSGEGNIEWIDIKDMKNIKQFEMNEKFSEYIFKESIFEAKYIFDNENKIKEYSITEM